MVRIGLNRHPRSDKGFFSVLTNGLNRYTFYSYFYQGDAVRLGGGMGRRKGLKIPRSARDVPVRLRPQAPNFASRIPKPDPFDFVSAFQCPIALHCNPSNRLFRSLYSPGLPSAASSLSKKPG